MNLDQARQTFIAESRELLQELEDHLLGLEDASDEETVNAIFRAVHTIKGSAGLFGLDYVVDFTHVVENLLDRLREGVIAPDRDRVALLLDSRDHIAVLVDWAADNDDPPGPEVTDPGQALLTRLRRHLGDEATPPPVASTAQVERSGGGPLDHDTWHLSLRFGPEVLREGMDPLSFIRYLSTLGEITHLTTLPDALPEAQDMDPEACYLGFEIELRAQTDKDTLYDVFEFVREESRIHILPPHSKTADYIQLIQSLPEDDARLGEILVASGALTRDEVNEGLQLQSGDAAPRPQLGSILVDQQVVQPELVAAALDKQTRNREHRNRESRYVRVPADKLDRLINLVGELVIAGAAVSLGVQRGEDRALQEHTNTLTRLMEEIRDGALGLRMVQIGETFNRFRRVVHDVSQELGKDMDLVIRGTETELDKTVVERITDPLTHLVRNAIDHGIEPAQVRRERGKPERGTLLLNAYHDSGGIVIEISDDGGGLDRDRILAKARERGVVEEDQTLSDEQINRLIFEAGFSTADSVSNLSGRGVGMDVVRRNIEALRGSVDLESQPGQGTTFRIRLPLTLAIIDGFLMEVGGGRYVVPLDAVVECVELSAAQRREMGGRHFINLRGRVLPVVRLREHFHQTGTAGRRENVVVVQYAGRQAGLVVDELKGELQTVIKPLGRLFSHLKSISGSTILGSGEVALILDVPALVARAAQHETHTLPRAVGQ